MFDITPIPAFSDNYIWLLCDPASDEVLVVDPGEAPPVLQALKQRSLSLTGILVTHHHPDHVGGIAELLDHYPVPVYGPENPAITEISHRVRESDRLEIGGNHFEILAVPGHTLDHIAWYAPAAVAGRGLLLCGDTLFAAGCGRLFEGTPKMMWHSLQKLASLPEDTLVCCAHEYTLANLHFALAAEPDNERIQQRLETERSRRDRGEPTLPSSIGLELATNPFLRCTAPALMRHAAESSGQPAAELSAVESFAALRSWKDRF